MKLAAIYALLAVIATATNIGAQAGFLLVYAGAYAIALSIMVGTGIGLIVKYGLDKRYIFRFKAENAAHDRKVFILYASTGVLTTAVFWGFELSFHTLFGTDQMRYLGGVIGLAIGYVTKYELDKRFVFRSQAQPAC
ncbi:MAG: GtrA family protein [Pseudomonas sp.]|uniref:GtrA family protein n=1 Tax=Pseudomonas sp. TaxID=306 RepID=UPI0027336873|nr:GtrA family protein [Pseudomonas sp.]MDP3847586.1 GtrA family protein [Pseudomonas sp.]